MKTVSSLNVGRIAVLAQQIHEMRLDLKRKEAELKDECEGKKTILHTNGLRPSQTPEAKHAYYLRRKARLAKVQRYAKLADMRKNSWKNLTPTVRAKRLELLAQARAKRLSKINS